MSIEQDDTSTNRFNEGDLVEHHIHGVGRVRNYHQDFATKVYVYDVEYGNTIIRNELEWRLAKHESD